MVVVHIVIIVIFITVFICVYNKRISNSICIISNVVYIARMMCISSSSIYSGGGSSIYSTNSINSSSIICSPINICNATSSIYCIFDIRSCNNSSILHNNNMLLCLISQIGSLV